MALDVTLFDPRTQERVVYPDTYASRETREAFLFLWLDGNYGCDCNRGAFMADALGREDPDYPCGETIQLESIVDPNTGEVVWPPVPTNEAELGS